MTDARASKGMMLRHGSGKVKHLSTKQLWVQGAVRAYGVEVVKIPRAANLADMLTHDVTHRELCENMNGMRYDLKSRGS